MTGAVVRRTNAPLSQDADAMYAAGILITVAIAVLVHFTVISAAAILILIVLAALRPSASVVALPAVVGFVFDPVWFRSLRFSPQETLLATTITGTGAHVLWASKRGDITGQIRQFVAEVRTRLLPVDALAVIFLVLGVVSLFTLAMPAYRHDSLRDFRWTVLEPVIFYALARWFYRTRSTRRLAVILFIGGAMLVAITGIAGLISGHALSVEGVSRVSGVYPQPNALALFLERPLLLAVGLAFVFQSRLKWAWVGAASLIGVVLVMTFSRGAILAVGITIVAILFIGQRRRLAGLATAGGLVLGGTLAIIASARIDNLFAGGSGSLRLDLWESSLQMIRDHPIFGIGPDQFLYVYAPRYIKPQAWSERFTSHPHDIILDVWLRLGIMGVVLALAYLAVFAWMTWGIIRKRHVLGLAASGGIIVGMLHGLVDNGYFLPDLALIFWFLTALLAAAYQEDLREIAPHI